MEHEASLAALERTVKRVFPNAKAGDIWKGIMGWRIPRPAKAIRHAQTGTYEPGFTIVGYAPRKTGFTVYFLDPGDYYVLEKHGPRLAKDGLGTGRGCIYWAKKGVIPTSALEAMFRAVKARDAKTKPKAAHAPPSNAAAKRKAAATKADG